MAIYAISDLHLSLSKPKPMDIFGAAWENHAEKLRSNWESLVRPDDVVLMPGDLSWGMRLSEARPDLRFVDELPGRKVLVRGNHDYWWNRKATSRIQREVDHSFTFLQGTSITVGSVGITGTRGWREDSDARGGMPADGGPEEPVDREQAQKIFHRELRYLEAGIQSIPGSVSTRIAMLHYPPFDEKLQPNEFAEMLSRHSFDALVYGHVHLGTGNWVEGLVGGVRYHMVSADVVDFVPQLILR